MGLRTKNTEELVVGDVIVTDRGPLRITRLLHTITWTGEMPDGQLVRGSGTADTNWRVE